MKPFSLQPSAQPLPGRPHPSPSPPHHSRNLFVTRPATGGHNVATYSVPTQHMAHPEALPLFFPAPESAGNSFKSLPPPAEEQTNSTAPVEYGFDPFAAAAKARASSARPKSNRKPPRDQARSSSKSFSQANAPNSPLTGPNANWRDQSRSRSLSNAQVPGSPGPVSYGPRRGRTPMLSPMMSPLLTQNDSQNGNVPSFSLDGGHKRHVGFQTQEEDGHKEKKPRESSKHGNSRPSSRVTARSSSRSSKFGKNESSEPKAEKPTKMVDDDGWELVVNNKKKNKK